MKSILPWVNKEKNSSFANIKNSLMDFKNWEPFSLNHSFSDFPNIDVSQSNKEVIVKAELPGMNEKDIDVSYLDGSLYIKGEKKEQYEENKNNFFHKESWYGTFSRSIPLGNNLIWDNVLAKFKDGVLTVKIPKKENTGKKININVE